MTNTRPTVLVLAAGQSRRFGAAGHKLMQPLGAGTVFTTTLRHAIETRWPVAVVTTAALAPSAAPLVATRDLLVRPSSIVAVGRALADNAVAYTQHRGRRGHPVGFAAELVSELIGLTGDEGARRLVARYPALAVELDDPGVLIDVDTEADLAAARAAAGVA